MSPASYQTAPPRDDFRSVGPFGQRRAGNGTRTRDPDLGKVVLYQLSYSRNPLGKLPEHAERRNLQRVEARGIEPLTS
jgi:hypothetical protein